MRNSLITHAMHGQIDGKVTSRWLAREITECLTAMQYGLAYTMIRGIEDFLEGPEVLHDGGPSALAAIRAERSEFAETVVHPAVKIGELTGAVPRIVPLGHAPARTGSISCWPNALSTNGSGRAIPGPVAITAGAQRVVARVAVRPAVVTDASQAGVRIRRRDKQKLTRLSRRESQGAQAFREEAPSLQEKYREALPELTGRENWARLYES